MNITYLLERASHTNPDAPAVFRGKQQIYSYQSLRYRAGQVAAYLIDQGCTAGSRVAIYMPNLPEYLELIHGIWLAGLVAVPINAKLHPREVKVILTDSEAEVIFTSANLAADLENALGTKGLPRTIAVPDGAAYKAIEAHRCVAAPVDCQSDDLAWLFYTSGTTGKPKGVMLTHRNLMAMTAAYFMDVDHVSDGDTMIYAAPMSHGAGLYHLTHIHKAGKHVTPEADSFDPAEVTALANHHGRASLFAAPTMVKRLVDFVAHSNSDVSGFKTIIYGGGPMYLEDIRRALNVVGNRFVQIYGQGETPMTITCLSRSHLADRTHKRHLARIASVGRPYALVEVCVADENGKPLPVGEIGEVLVRGDTVMKGYWKNLEATKQTIRDGWLWTGDIGVFDADGFLTLKDRSKDVIISGGSNIYPREIEEILLSHPCVREVSVVGRPDPEWGELVMAFVVLQPNANISETELDELCLRSIARFKRPKSYKFVDELPKNSYGKVLKSVVRELSDLPSAQKYSRLI